jgi:threonine synthase
LIYPSFAPVCILAKLLANIFKILSGLYDAEAPNMLYSKQAIVLQYYYSDDKMSTPPDQSGFTHLECPNCGCSFDANCLQTICQDCQSPLLARYDLAAIGKRVQPRDIRARPKGIWRWAEFLPVVDPAYRLTLGEGDTPLLVAPRLATKLGINHLYIKDESLNPTGTFKARGLAVAVARAIELGVDSFVIPSTGNAGGALAAYAARAKKKALVFMPNDTPAYNSLEVRKVGAELHLVDGVLSEAAQAARAEVAAHTSQPASNGHSWLDVSTFREPYRLEGKKTMGFEIAESFDWELPEVIIYPTGGGTGLVGIWKAFDELLSLGWINVKRPRMVCVQANGCAPVVRAFQNGDRRVETWHNPQTIAVGLRVPSVFADRLILNVLSESHGAAITVNDDEIIQAQNTLAKTEGIFAAPEGAATLAALGHLIKEGWIQKDERIVLLNTGSGLKYV